MSEPEPEHLKRVLGLWDLVFYGIVLIQPIAAVGLFGVGQQLSNGHMSTTILIAMLAMAATAISYGRMASVYPSAGSAYTFVSRGLNTHLGFLVGWVTVMDYFLIPVISTVYASLTLTRLMPEVPFFVWVIGITAVLTLMNLRGIRSTTLWNRGLLLAMCVVIVAYFALAIIYLLRNGTLWSVEPFYNADTFQLGSILTATSFVALTYIGFDSVTTLAEEVKNPRRNVLLASVIVCLLTGLFSITQIYLAARIWPDYHSFPQAETAFFDVCARIGGVWFFNVMAVTLLVACVGTAWTGQAAGARLLYGMGRDGVLPRRFFGRINEKSKVPDWNVLLLGAATVAGALFLSYEHAAQTLNFGAFLAFMGVNAAVVRTFYFNREGRHLGKDLIAPAIGFLFCAAIWLSLPLPAKIVGGLWLLAGIVYLVVLKPKARQQPVPELAQNEG